MEFIFEFLFKYRPLLYDRGTVSFRPPWPPHVTWLLAVAAVAVALFTYLKVRGDVPIGWRILLSSLRGMSLLVVLLLLTQPVLLVPSVIPQKSFVALAYDTSRSMEIRDGAGGRPRLDIEGELLKPGPASMIEALGRRFKLRYFRFAGSAERVGGYEEVKRRGGQTNLERSLDTVLGEFANAPVAGIILLTDGADNRSVDLPGLIARLRARRVPLYAIGIGSPSITRDIELVQVSAPRRVLKDSIIDATLSVRTTGGAGRKSRLVVREGERELRSAEVTLGNGGEVKSHRVTFPSGPAGAHVYSFRIEPLPDEQMIENNGQDILIEVEDSQPQILYVEGEPRWVFGFMRRAAEKDKNIRLVTLLRQATGKFLRQGVESSSTLEKGFPADARELFGYKALVAGSVEASFFSFEQLRLISEFVSRRGGGFLMLGGRSSFAQGGYASTPVEDLLPLVIRPDRATESAGFQELEFKARLTPYGLEHPVTRISVDDTTNRRRWEDAPMLHGLNPTFGVKAGATVLATAAPREATGQMRSLLAFQRFGRGRSMALTTGSVWRWRMEMDHRDDFHDLFWRQLLRWLVAEAPDPVSVGSSRHSFSLDEAVAITAEVRDADFTPLNNARVILRVKAPSGQEVVLPAGWDTSKEGFYSAAFKPIEEGIHQVSVEASAGDRSVGRSSSYFRIGDSNEEYHGARMNADLLRLLAKETGGRYYAPHEAGTLVEDVSYVDNGASQIEEKAIWDMPFLFLLLSGAICTEWIVRKKWGLA
ncbi:MAG: hypothetical protein HXY20_08910 [Acidobacteria bacterium]|nr:hypothetical protein [Acidobacteriota bacterium]